LIVVGIDICNNQHKIWMIKYLIHQKVGSHESGKTLAVRDVDIHYVILRVEFCSLSVYKAKQDVNILEGRGAAKALARCHCIILTGSLHSNARDQK
jgi:hypothetical protein